MKRVLPRSSVGCHHQCRLCCHDPSSGGASRTDFSDVQEKEYPEVMRCLAPSSHCFMETEQGFRQRYALVERIGIGGGILLSPAPYTGTREFHPEESNRSS